MKNNLVRLGGILCLISAIAGGILAFANDFTKDKIADAEAKAAMDPAVLQSVMPGAEMFDPWEDVALVESIKAENAKFIDLLVAVDGSGNKLGDVVRTLSTVPGYGGDMELFVGFTPDGKISGVNVIAHTETSGLGSRTTEPEFQSQFIGLDTSAEIVDFDALTGA
ncbi:MAG: FMN-binding protein, partial [Sedimentibacter sp.]